MNAKNRRVLIWGTEDLLSSSVQSFLRSTKEWTVVNLCDGEDTEALLLAVEKTQPGIVIINLGGRQYPTDLPLQLLQNHPTLKVITVSLENNSMEVFNKQHIVVKEASDLISVIENDP
jgi:DNA-binding NarL/FixJ family response regulator